MSAIWHEYRNTFYCCRRQIFYIKAFLCSMQYSCIVDTEVAQQYTHNAIWFSIATVVTRTRHDTALQEHCHSYTTRRYRNTATLTRRSVTGTPPLWHDAALQEHRHSPFFPPSPFLFFPIQTQGRNFSPFCAIRRNWQRQCVICGAVSCSPWRLLRTTPEIPVFRKFLMTPHILDASHHCLDVRYELMSALRKLIHN
jgi:hypothetical protein